MAGEHDTKPAQGDQPDYHSATAVSVGGAAWVCQITFGETRVKQPEMIAGSAPPGTVQIADVPQHVVSLPWPLAKALYSLLGDVIGQYEKIEGEIQLPRSFLEQLRASRG